MADLNILQLKLPTLDGNSAVLDLKSLQESNTTEFTGIKQRLDALESGSRQFALKDYSQVVNQSEMVVNVYYYVPFTSDDVFVQLNEHGQPTGDAQIAYFDVYMKGSDGVVTKITRQYTDGNLEGVLYTNKANVLTAGGKISKTSNAATFAEIADLDLVSKGEVALETARIDAAITAITDGTTQIKIKDATNAVKGIVLLSDAVDGTQDAATGVTAATPKAVADAKTAVETALKAVTDVIGTKAENVAKLNSANTFTTDGFSLTLNGKGLTGGADTDLHLGSGTTEVVIGSDGSITRTEMPGEADDTEIPTKKYVDDKVSAVTIPDASTEAAGKVEIATAGEVTSGTALKVVDAAGLKTVTDAINQSISDIVDGTTQITVQDASESQKGVVQLASTAEVTTGTDTAKAVTAAGVKAALDLKIQVVTDASQATQVGVLYLVVQPQA